MKKGFFCQQNLRVVEIIDDAFGHQIVEEVGRDTMIAEAEYGEYAKLVINL